MSVKSNFPAIRPSLLLDFANSKSLDPRVTFSRASAATYYDGKTVAKAEENLFVYSQDFSNSNWGKFGVGTGVVPTITPDYAIAPDGTATADRAILSLGGGTTTNDISHIVQTLTLSGTYTMSVWLKSTDGTSTYTLQLSAASIVTTIEVTGVWQRFTVTGTYNGSYSNQIRLRGGNTPINSSSCDILVWGAQLEQRASVTAYTPTTAQPITNYIPVLQTELAGIPRFDHNPVTGESLGLLIEEQRTNLLLRSEEFSNASWGKVGSSILPNALFAPDGSLTVDKLVENLASGVTHGVDQSITTTATSYTFSAYVKPAERSRFRFASAIGLAPAASFDLLAVTATPLGSTTSATITPVGNGWFRCTATRTVSAGSDVAQIQLLNNNGLEAYTGDGYSGLYIWGAQLEAGTFPTSYIKTEASQVTRVADSATMTGTNFSAWYRQDEGTLYAEFNVPSTLSSVAGIGADTFQSNLTFNNQQLIRFAGASPSLTLGTSVAGPNKLASVIKNGDYAATSNGQPLSKSSVILALPPAVHLRIGGAYGGFSATNGTIKRLTYYPKRLTDAQLQALTA